MSSFIFSIIGIYHEDYVDKNAYSGVWFSRESIWGEEMSVFHLPMKRLVTQYPQVPWGHLKKTSPQISDWWGQGCPEQRCFLWLSTCLCNSTLPPVFPFLDFLQLKFDLEFQWHGAFLYDSLPSLYACIPLYLPAAEFMKKMVVGMYMTSSLPISS